MRKLAAFTEGQTEQIFLRRFIEEIAGSRDIHFEIKSMSGFQQITRMKSDEAKEGKAPYSVLLYNCQGDAKVKSEILDQLDSLTRAGYHLILGLRDLYPQPISDLPAVKRGLMTRVPTSGVPIHILLAVSEIESWFLQDHDHFAKIDSALDVETFHAIFGFDPRTDSAEAVEHPAALLHRIYSSVGKAYKKTRSHVERTVQYLDYDALYCSKGQLLPHLQSLVDHLDQFFGERAPDASP